ncbi:MAG TPA: hypothetical protein ENN41_06685 [Sediminispirochaeta sp.]|nr:hypothetical protein [Sediminispirochaeta sp.]
MSIHFVGEKTLRFVYSLLLLAAVILVAWGILLSRDSRPEIAFYHRSTGVIQDFTPLSQHGYRVEVEFPISREQTLSGAATAELRSPPVLGQKVMIHYNPHTPEEFQVRPLPPIAPEWLYFFGIMTGGLGFRLMVSASMRSMKIRVLKEHGKRIVPHRYAVIEKNLRVMKFINIPVLLIHCQWDSPIQQQSLEFYSETYPRSKRGSLQLDKIQIFYLPKVPQRYYVEIPEG